MTHINELIQQVENRLAEAFAADGDGLEAKLRQASPSLPDDLSAILQDLATQAKTLETGASDPVALAFQCGIACEKLESIAKDAWLASVGIHSTDGEPLPLDMAKPDYATLSRFVAWRNRWLTIIADYTLKFLLVSLVLLVLGFFLGLI